jgi:hypothetical protein
VGRLGYPLEEWVCWALPVNADPSFIFLTVEEWWAYRLRELRRIGKDRNCHVYKALFLYPLTLQLREIPDAICFWIPATCFPSTLEQGEGNITGNGHAGVALPIYQMLLFAQSLVHVVVLIPV